MYRSTVLRPLETAWMPDAAASPTSLKNERRPTSACQGLRVRRVHVQGGGGVLEAVRQRKGEVVLAPVGRHVVGEGRGVIEKLVHGRQAVEPLHYIAPFRARTRFRPAAEPPGWL